MMKECSVLVASEENPNLHNGMFLSPYKGLRILVIGWFNNCCGNAPFFVGNLIFFFYRPMCVRGYWNQTKFPRPKVSWLREASQIEQTFIPLCEKVV